MWCVISLQVSQYYETISIHTDSSNNNATKIKSSDQITRIYATATMWHETEDEMIEMLKSILRMDEDQSARRVAQKYLKIVDLDYYEFESKAFFWSSVLLLFLHYFILLKCCFIRTCSSGINIQLMPCVGVLLTIQVCVWPVEPSTAPLITLFINSPHLLR